MQDIQVKRALFGKVQNLTLFVEDNYGEDETRISYLGFKGDWMQLGRAPTDMRRGSYEPPPETAIVPTPGVDVVNKQGRLWCPLPRN